MADIFVSYASANRARVHVLAVALGAQGWTVWWDREIPIGKSYQSVITEALTSALAVTVVWSGESIVSNWVIEEAEEGKKKSSLFPVLIDDVQAPVGFRLIQAADLRNWTGDQQHPEFQLLLRSMSIVLGGARELATEDAVRRILKFCELRRVRIAEIRQGARSSTGTKYIIAPAMDGMGIIYCHLTGLRLGDVYYVRKGISLYYHLHVGGPGGAMGLPISNEEVADPKGFPTTYFENGFIEWSPTTGEARAVLTGDGDDVQIGIPAVI